MANWMGRSTLLVGIAVFVLAGARALAGPIPSLDPNLRLWLDAKDNSTFTFGTGTNVSQWNDKSGFGNNATQSADAQRPNFTASAVDGQPGLLFVRANNDAMRIPNIQPNNISIFAVSYPLSMPVGALDIIADPRTNTAPWHNYRLTDRDGLVDATSNDSLNIASGTYSSAPQISDMVWDGTTMTFRKITDAAITQATGSGNSGNIQYAGNPGYLTLGAWRDVIDAGSEHFDGYISEVLIFNRALTAAEREQVEIYLRNRWDINFFTPPLTPEPASVILWMGFGAMAICVVWYRRRGTRLAAR